MSIPGYLTTLFIDAMTGSKTSQQPKGYAMPSQVLPLAGTDEQRQFTRLVVGDSPLSKARRVLADCYPLLASATTPHLRREFETVRKIAAILGVEFDDDGQIIE